MGKTNRTHTPAFKAQVALAAIKGDRTISQVDWFSRFVVSWRLSNTLNGAFCQEMLEEALSRGTPEVFNTDQGAQFTARVWTSRLEGVGVAVSTDGKGRYLDNIFVERLWRSVEYKDGAGVGARFEGLLRVLHRAADSPVA
jgi:transposase InsO family protein